MVFTERKWKQHKRTLYIKNRIFQFHQTFFVYISYLLVTNFLKKIKLILFMSSPQSVTCSCVNLPHSHGEALLPYECKSLTVITNVSHYYIVHSHLHKKDYSIKSTMITGII